MLILGVGVALEFAHLKGNATAVPFVLIVWGAGIVLICAWALRRNSKKLRDLRPHPDS